MALNLYVFVGLVDPVERLTIVDDSRHSLIAERGASTHGGSEFANAEQEPSSPHGMMFADVHGSIAALAAET